MNGGLRMGILWKKVSGGLKRLYEERGMMVGKQ